MPTKLSTFRFAPAVLSDLDRIAAHLSGMTRSQHSRADAVRYAVGLAIEMLDAPRLTTPAARQKKSGKIVKNNA